MCIYYILKFDDLGVMISVILSKDMVAITTVTLF